MTRPIQVLARVGAVVAVVAVAAATSVGWGAAAAQAHAALVSTTPQQGATLAAAPKQVVLTFSDPLDPKLVRVAFTGPQRPTAPEATTSGNRVQVPLPDQGPGAYQLSYRVVSADGHPVSGRLRFTVASAGAGATPSGRPTSSGSGTSHSTATATGAAVGLAAGSDAASGSSGPNTAAVVGLVAAGAAVLVGLGVVLRRRARTRSGQG